MPLARKGVLVIGATGYIGSHVAAAMQERGHAVTAYVRSDASAAKARALGFEPWPGALEELAGRLDGHDTVIFAPQLAHEVEATVVRQILDAMSGSDRTFVFTSGTGVFAQATQGEWSDISYSETEAYVPFPPAQHRIGTEALIRAAGAGKLRTIILRPPTVFGYGGGRHVPFVFNSVDRTGAACYIGRGLNLYSNVHIDDLAELYCLAFESGTSGAVYHAVGGEADFRSIAGAVASVRNCPVRSITLQEAEALWGARPAQWMFNVSSRSRAVQSRAQLGWKPGPVELIEDIKSGSYSGL